MCIQFKEIFQSLDKNIIEIGAGSGKFALEVIQSLEADSESIDHYFILEISQSLRKQQYDLLIEQLPSNLFNKVQWINEIPKNMKALFL